MDTFRATLRQHYQLKEHHLLVLETYVGDIAPGDHLAVQLADGTSAAFRVHDLAWGSAFNAKEPPLTLIVKNFVAKSAPVSGAIVSTIED